MPLAARRVLVSLHVQRGIAILTDGVELPHQDLVDLHGILSLVCAMKVASTTQDIEAIELTVLNKGKIFLLQFK